MAQFRAREKFKTGRPLTVIPSRGGGARAGQIGHRWRTVGFSRMDGPSSKTNSPEKLL